MCHNEYTGWYFQVYAPVHLLRRESSTHGQAAWLPTQWVGLGWVGLGLVGFGVKRAGRGGRGEP